MASKSSKALPYLVLAIVVASLWYEVKYGVEVDLEAFEPILLALGLGGAGLSAVKHAAGAKKLLPENLEATIKDRLKEIEATLTSRIDTKLKG